MMRTIRWILAVLSIAAMLSACEGNGNEAAPTPTPSGSPVATPDATPAASAEPEPALFEVSACPPVSLAFEESNSGFYPVEAKRAAALEHIRMISTGRMTDDAGYGSRFGSSLALDDQGQAYRWGLPSYPFMREGTPYPVKAADVPPLETLAGEYGLTKDGKVWFLNGFDEAYELAELPAVAAIAEAAEGELLALDEDGRLWIRERTGEREYAIERLQTERRFAAIAAGPHRAVGIQEDGSAWFLPTMMSGPIKEATRVPLAEDQKAMHAVVTMENQAYLRLADGHWVKVDADGKVELAAGYEDVAQIAGMNGALFALKEDSTVWVKSTLPELAAFGYGQELRPFEELSGIRQLAAGSDHMLALAEDGRVYSWGYNMFGQLGRMDNHYEQPTLIGLGDADAWDIADGLRWLKDGIVIGLDGSGRLTGYVDDAALLRGDDLITRNGEAMLNYDGQGECETLAYAHGKIADVIQGYTGKLMWTEDGRLFHRENNQEESSELTEVAFEPQLSDAVKQWFDYPVPMALTETGRLYYLERGNERMKLIPESPVVESVASLKYTFFYAEDAVTRVLDAQGNVYDVHHEMGEEEIRFAFEPAAQGAARISGGLIVYADGTFEEDAAYWDNTTGTLRNPSEIEDILSSYSVYIEGPISRSHLIRYTDGSLEWLGDVPFAAYDFRPGLVIAQ